MQGAKIGRNCLIGQNVFVASSAVIGDGVKIQNNVSICDCVVLEDGVFCGPSAVFMNVINPRSEIDGKDQYQPTLVQRGATLGPNSTILCGQTIGEYAFVAAGAVVTVDVPPFVLVAGVPAKQIGWICRCGASRLGLDNSQLARCFTCGRRYQRVHNVVRECPPVSKGSTADQPHVAPNRLPYSNEVFNLIPPGTPFRHPDRARARRQDQLHRHSK